MMRVLDRLAAALARQATASEGSLDRRFVLKALVVAYVVFCATYLPINEFSVGRDAHTLFLPGEDRIPFVPEFEFLYIWGYFFPLLLLRRPPDVRRLVRLTCAYALTLGVAYTTYLVFPVYFERPDLEVDSIATFLLSIEYLDRSYNHFPSLHVAIAWLVVLACLDRARRRAPLILAVLGLAVSTLFVKQHYIVDVVYGSALPMAAWAVAGRWLASRHPRPSLAGRARLEVRR